MLAELNLKIMWALLGERYLKFEKDSMEWKFSIVGYAIERATRQGGHWEWRVAPATASKEMGTSILHPQELNSATN